MKTGWYLCGVSEWAARDQSEKDKGSLAVSVSLKLKTHALWNDKIKAWERADEEEEVFGDYYVIKKDGQFNPSAIEQLTEAGLWDSDKLFLRFDEPVPEGLEIGVSVEQDEYNGKKRWRANWIIHADAQPGERGIANKASKEKLLALNSKFGSGLRAMAPAKKKPELVVTESAPWDSAQVAAAITAPLAGATAPRAVAPGDPTSPY